MRRLFLSAASLTFVLAACSGSNPPGASTPCNCPPGSSSSGPGATGAPNASPTAEDARAFLKEVDAELRKRWTAAQYAGWVNENFITDDTDAMAAKTQEASMAYVGRAIHDAHRFDAVLKDLTEEEQRQFLLLKTRAAVPLAPPSTSAENEELAKLAVDMTSEYGKGKYCPKTLKGTFLKVAEEENAKDPPKCLGVDALDQVLARSRDWDELAEAWKGWHAISPQMRKQYERYVQLGNAGAKEIGFDDLGVMWRSIYDMPPDAFAADVDRLWEQVKPLYEQLHCYVRGKLRAKYGKDKIPEKGLIPIQTLGNMWGQEWNNVYGLTEPYPGQPSLDVTAHMKKKGLDEKGVVRLGEKFFTSLGMDALPDTFWTRSLFKKPVDHDVVCHASAWDPGYDNDLRIKMCVQIDEEDLMTVHHELGHDYYFHSYYSKPMLFQDGANDGFHEAIGDTIALSVTPGYLKSIGLLDAVPGNDKAQINALFKRALEKVAFLPFGKMIDRWRWDVFSGKTPPSEYNAAWWKLHADVQGVAPAAPRTEQDFDPGAKFHVPGNTPYIRYFLAFIYQFQFHRALCKAAGFEGPLSQCSIYGSAAAGAKLKAMLEMGASKPWTEALKAISGETKADAGALLEYFAPLEKWLKEQNAGEKCGW